MRNPARQNATNVSPAREGQRAKLRFARNPGLVEEYRRMNLADQRTFKRWLAANMIAGVALIAATFIFAGVTANTTTAQKNVPFAFKHGEPK